MGLGRLREDWASLRSLYISFYEDKGKANKIQSKIFFFLIRHHFDYLNTGKFSNPFFICTNVDKKEQTTGPFGATILTLALLKNVFICLCHKPCWNQKEKKLNFVNKVQKDVLWFQERIHFGLTLDMD